MSKKKRKLNRQIKISPIIATIVVAIIGVLGTVFGGITQGYFNYKLEQLKFESSLILKAVSVDDISKAEKNLDFLTRSGLLNKTQNDIYKLVKEGGFSVYVNGEKYDVINYKIWTPSPNTIKYLKENGQPSIPGWYSINEKTLLNFGKVLKSNGATGVLRYEVLHIGTMGWKPGYQWVISTKPGELTEEDLDSLYKEFFKVKFSYIEKTE